jgi:hypothetical protein
MDDTFAPEQVTKAKREVEVQLYSFFNLGAGWGGWSTPRLGRFTPGKDPVAIVLIGLIVLTPTRIRSADRPARSVSLHRLSYPGPFSKEGSPLTF